MSEAGDRPGPRLKVERERRGLSAQKAADDMHLDAWVIDALEADNYERIGPAVYAKGHLKKYASLLGLPAEEILAGYALVASPVAAPPPPSNVRLRTTDTAASQVQWPLIIGGVLAAFAIAGLFWWKHGHPHAAAVPATDAQPIASAAQSAEPDSAPLPASAVAAPAAGAAAPIAGAVPPAAGVAVPAGAVATPAAGLARLRMSFSADSWVEVINAAGQRVFAGYGRANTVKTIAGSAPLRIYLKQAGGVQLEINEHAVAIAPQFVNGNVARFEAGADGVLRRDTHDVRTHD
jgi:cytoskeleton protein RodZ